MDQLIALSRLESPIASSICRTGSHPRLSAIDYPKNYRPLSMPKLCTWIIQPLIRSAQSSQLKLVIVDWPKGISIVIETRASIVEATRTRTLPRRSSTIDPTQNRRTQPCCRIMTTSPRVCWGMRQQLQTPNHGLGPIPVLCQILQLGIPLSPTNSSLLARFRRPTNPEPWPNPHSTRRNAGTGCL
jgi:hypothetical protein